MQQPELKGPPAKTREATRAPLPPPSTGGGAKLPPRAKWLLVATVGLVICFSRPLYDLFRFSFHSELYSYILLVPIISLYLVWLQRHRLRAVSPSSAALTLILLSIGVALVAAYWAGVLSGWQPTENDRLSLMMLALVFFFSSACALLLGNPTLRVIAFPMAFLIFMAPLPSVLEHGLETFLQHASADAAYVLLKLSGMPILREGTQFQMPGIRIEIAPECSGIHSSLVLFVTSLLAGHFFLRRLWTKVTLSLSVILLGILRNAVRIFTLSQLCVHVDPHIFDSPLHHKGGPLFFVASLLPFCLLLWFLRKIEFSRNGERDYI